MVRVVGAPLIDAWFVLLYGCVTNGSFQENCLHTDPLLLTTGQVQGQVDKNKDKWQEQD